MSYLLFFIVVFVGYAIGRRSHIIGGKLGDKGVYYKTPHHWVYGVIAIIVGLVFYKHAIARLLLAFGIGHTISDLNDLLNGRVFDSSHEPDVKKFWGID